MKKLKNVFEKISKKSYSIFIYRKNEEKKLHKNRQ